MLAVASIIAACTPASPEVVEKVITQVVKETVIVEGTPKVVEKEVTKVVKETVVVEKPAPPGADTDVPREETLIMAFEGGPVAAPDLANPYITGNRINQGYHQASIESLFYLNYESGEMMPWLGEGYEFNDDLTEVTISLRKGVEWSDGEPFTSEDVVFTVNMLREHTTFSYGNDMKKWVKEVSAPDDFTVVFELTEPYPRFVLDFFAVRIWGMVRIVPEHIWSEQDVETFRNFDMDKGWPVWTGPYQLVKASENEFIYDRRDDWWGAKIGFHELPAAKRLIFVEQGTAEKGAAMLQYDQIDAHTRMPLGLFESIMEKNPNVIGWLADSPYGWFDPCPRTYFINNLREPWDDPDMRWALNHALDRQKIADAALGGPGGIPTGYIFAAYPPLQEYVNENKDLWEKYPVTEYNPERSIEIIESKGYVRGNDGIFQKDGKPLQITIVAWSTWMQGPLTMPLVVGYWQAIGIDATVNFLAGAALNEKRNTGDFDVVLVSPCYSVVDGYKSVDAFHSRYIKPLGERQSGNYCRFSDPAYDAIADKMANYPVGDPGLKPLWREAMEIWLPNLPVLPINQRPRIIPLNTTYWTNWPTAENNYIHPATWWASTFIMIMEVQPAQ
jgi:peptide/nickel transport system substrate-binding protein